MVASSSKLQAGSHPFEHAFGAVHDVDVPEPEGTRLSPRYARA
jgi:hypothetical protein